MPPLFAPGIRPGPLREPCLQAAARRCTLSDMSCLAGIFALFMPRVVIILVVLFSDYIGESCQTVLWPLLGFFFMPLTTLAYAWAWHMEPAGSVSGFGLAVVIIAALIDLGIVGGNASNKRVRTYYGSVTGSS